MSTVCQKGWGPQLSQYRMGIPWPAKYQKASIRVLVREGGRQDQAITSTRFGGLASVFAGPVIVRGAERRARRAAAHQAGAGRPEVRTVATVAGDGRPGGIEEGVRSAGRIPGQAARGSGRDRRHAALNVVMPKVMVQEDMAAHCRRVGRP